MLTDCYEYVRRTYGVPAYIGVRVKYRGEGGVIVGAKTDLHYVHALRDGAKRADLFHPTDLLYEVMGVNSESEA